jgi:hypothetical protein
MIEWLGGGNVHAEIRVSPSGRKVRFEIQDTEL